MAVKGPALTVEAMSTWQNANKHVDTNIAKGNFTSAAYTVVFVRVRSNMSGNSELDVFRPIGVIQNWTFSENRQIEEIWEIGSDTKYLIPGRTTGQINILRFLIDGADLVNTMYNTTASGQTVTATDSAYASLKQINSAVDLLFVVYENAANDNTGDPNHALMVRYFDNCWIAARQESITANQILIAENVTIMYENMLTTVTVADSGAIKLSPDLPDSVTG